MTVYKGKGKHIPPESPAMNFDGSAVSLRLHMEKFSINFVDKFQQDVESHFFFI